MVALLSLGNQFGDLRIFVAFTFIGFATSWWQQKRNQPLPNFKILLNLLFIGLTIRALLPFFINQPTDILSGLIKTWIYFLILHTFTVLSKRDYYFLMLLSLGLIVFCCFSKETSEIYKLRYITLFFIVWILALRAISLLKDIKREKEIYYHTQKWLPQELKIGVIFILGMFILVVPIFSIIPRFDIPFPFYPLLEQKYSVSYADFPKGLMSFFSPSKEKLKEPEEEQVEAGKIEQEAKERLIEPQGKRIKPLFWHSPEECKDMLQELNTQVKKTKEEIERINKILQELAKEQEIPKIKQLIKERERLIYRREELEKSIGELQRQIELLKEEFLRTTQTESTALTEEAKNKDLLKSLKEKTQILEKSLQNAIKQLLTAKEELKRINDKIDEVREIVFHESMGGASAENRIQRMWARKEILEEKLESLEKKVKEVQEEYIETKKELSPQAVMEDLKKEAEKKEIPWFDLLFGILAVLIILILAFLFYCIIAFFLPYLREKNRFKKSFQKNNYNLSVVILYKFLCRALNIFGYKHPVIIDPREYLIKVIRRFENLRLDYSKLTDIFLEARYSTHKIIKNQVEIALHSYGNILSELKNAGSFWQKLILKLDFVFKLKI